MIIIGTLSWNGLSGLIQWNQILELLPAPVTLANGLWLSSGVEGGLSGPAWDVERKA